MPSSNLEQVLECRKGLERCRQHIQAHFDPVHEAVIPPYPSLSAWHEAYHDQDNRHTMIRTAFITAMNQTQSAVKCCLGLIQGVR